MKRKIITCRDTFVRYWRKLEKNDLQSFPSYFVSNFIKFIWNVTNILLNLKTI